LTVKKESANKGRLFRRCGQPDGDSCQFFEWADEPPRDAGNSTGTGMKRPGGPPNPPSIPAKRSRTDDAVRALSFFLVLQLAPRLVTFQAVQKKYCQCELTAVLKIVKKEGANQGRHYWSCPNSQAAACAFFEWEDDPASAVNVAPLNTRTQSAGSQQTTGECFNVS
jgi:DNA topoisomerase-3